MNREFLASRSVLFCMSVTPNAVIHLFRYDNRKKDLILSDSCREDKVCTVDMTSLDDLPKDVQCFTPSGNF